jgi:hypothetical protein
VRPEQLWEAAGPDKSDFQLQNALRHNLISDREFRELRSKYLIAGNFSFSMLLPLLMMVVLFTAGLSLRLVFLVPVAAAAFTMLLTTYAVDRRHQFRSEFRAVIVQRWEENNKPGARPAQKQNDTEPPPPAASSSSSTTFSSSSAAAGQDPDDPNMRGLA